MNQIERYLTSTKAELDGNGFQRICVWSTNNNDATHADVSEYETTVDGTTTERPIQRYLESHPGLVIGERGFQCHWVIPQKRLGSEFVPDFVVARLDSMGTRWTLIELQSPKAVCFNSKRRLSAQLNEGLSQIREWRRWLENNLDYARRERAKDGLGLKEISPSCEGLILIGRATDRNEETQAKLRQFKFDDHIEVHSYDWLAREAKKRIGFRVTRDDLGECNCY